MRAGFGLVAVMVTIAIMIWLWAQMVGSTAEHGLPAQKQAQQLAGQDENGRLAINSMRMSPEEQNGKLKYMIVDSIDPSGAYAKWFHLQVNDAIIAVGPMDLREQDSEMARALIQEAYQRKQELIVMRGGQKISLPEGRVIESRISLSELPTPTTKPAEPATAAQPDVSPLRRQLNAIPGIQK